MKKVILATDVFDPNTWEEFECEDIRDFLMSKFTIFPENARIYHKEVANICDITPANENDVDLLGSLEGPFIVVLYPGYDGGFSLYAMIAMVAISVAVSVYTYLSMPNVANKSQTAPSSSNSLSDRQNTARPRARIPDPFGTKRITPDLLQVPYRLFENNIEVEYCYMCIGRGQYDIDAGDIYDGDTTVSAIDGACVSVFAPDTAPMAGTPQLQINNSITQPVLNVYKSNAVNGQTIYAPNYKSIPPANYTTLIFTTSTVDSHLRLNVRYSSDVKSDYIFSVGDAVTISGADTITDGTHTVNLNGTYTVYTLTGAWSYTLVLTPTGSATTNAVTYLNTNFTSQTSNSTNAVTVFVNIQGSPNSLDPNRLQPYDRSVGPIYMNMNGVTGNLVLNLVAMQGLYYMDGDTQYALSDSFDIKVQPLDSSNAPTGSPVTTTEIVNGSKIDKAMIGNTFYIPTTTFSSYPKVAIYIKKTTSKLYNDGKTYVDEVQLRDLYLMTPVPRPTAGFGNITTIQTRSPATPSALGLKERKFNLFCTRKVPARIGSTSTFGTLTASNNAADIICAISLDPQLGNRSISELDITNIYDTVAAVETYFGVTEATEFCYVFDDDQITYEETIKIIANSIFCEAYRQGHVTKLFFEKENDNSMLLFNHRNKIPGSETRSIRFGTPDNCDGIELTYINPVDETEEIYYIPEDQSAVKPQTIKTIGVRNDKQAYLLAYRAWNKLRYQNISVEFTATQEANALVRNNRILIADNTRTDTQDGEVLSQNVLELTLSQPFEYDILDHVIFLQMYDGTVQSIDIASAELSPARNITLAEPPNLPLSLDYSLSRRTTYVIIKNDDSLGSAFLVDTKTPQDITKCQIVANNYDVRYYANDGDFK